MAETTRHVVEDGDRGRRIDRFLSERHEAISRSVIATLIEGGRARVDGATVAKGCRLKPGQTVELDLPDINAADSEIRPEPMNLAILYEDSEVVVVAKPPGLCVHPAPGHLTGTLVNGLLARYPGMAVIGSIRRPGVVHRLDLDTSGAIVFALTPAAYHSLVASIKDRRVRREYIAVVHGEPKSDKMTINLPVGRDPENRRRFMVSNVSHGGKSAVSHVEVVGRFGRASLVRVRLETGRTHQIRVHMSHIGHPVCGDRTYSPERLGMPIARQALHAHTLEFPHPIEPRTVSVTAPLPDDMRSLIAALAPGLEIP